MIVDLATLRRYAREWCDFAVGGDAGRTVDDPAYQAIVEGRDKGPGYSSCADLAHWLLFRLGCRQSFLNRAEHNGWKPVVNVGRLVRSPMGSNVFAVRYDGQALECGDIVVTWTKPDTTDAHVLVVDHIANGVLHSWDFGQGPMATEKWRGNRQHIEARKRSRKLGTFPICSVLPLAAVPFTAEPDLPSGERFDALERAR